MHFKNEMGYMIWMKMPEKNIHADHSDNTDDGHVPAEMTEQVSTIVRELKRRQIRRIRTGISWAEWETPKGNRLIKWYINELSRAGFDILPNLTYTPPRLGIRQLTNSPPKRVELFADFVDNVCHELSSCFEHVELWNEWNLVTDWDQSLDPEYDIFVDMIKVGGAAAKERGKKVVLGGASGLNDSSLRTLSEMCSKGIMENVDIVGFHALRGTWSDTSPPPSLANQAQSIRKVVGNVPIWLTEYGFPTVDPEKRYNRYYLEEIQCVLFADALKHIQENKLERVYWYTLKDQVCQSVRQVITGWEDVLQYFYGDTTEKGEYKMLATLLVYGGQESVLSYAEENNCWHLVEKASLQRGLPIDYPSQYAIRV